MTEKLNSYLAARVPTPVAAALRVLVARLGGGTRDVVLASLLAHSEYLIETHEHASVRAAARELRAAIKRSNKKGK